MAAAAAIAGSSARKLREDYIIPSVFDREVAPAVAAAVAARPARGIAAPEQNTIGFAPPSTRPRCAAEARWSRRAAAA